MVFLWRGCFDLSLSFEVFDRFTSHVYVYDGSSSSVVSLLEVAEDLERVVVSRCSELRVLFASS